MDLNLPRILRVKMVLNLPRDLVCQNEFEFTSDPARQMNLNLPQELVRQNGFEFASRSCASKWI